MPSNYVHMNQQQQQQYNLMFQEKKNKEKMTMKQIKFINDKMLPSSSFVGLSTIDSSTKRESTSPSKSNNHSQEVSLNDDLRKKTSSSRSKKNLDISENKVWSDSKPSSPSAPRPQQSVSKPNIFVHEIWLVDEVQNKQLPQKSNQSTRSKKNLNIPENEEWSKNSVPQKKPPPPSDSQPKKSSRSRDIFKDECLESPILQKKVPSLSAGTRLSPPISSRSKHLDSDISNANQQVEEKKTPSYSRSISSEYEKSCSRKARNNKHSASEKSN
jgi:hypothetical protein